MQFLCNSQIRYISLSFSPAPPLPLLTPPPPPPTSLSLSLSIWSLSLEMGRSVEVSKLPKCHHWTHCPHGMLKTTSQGLNTDYVMQFCVDVKEKQRGGLPNVLLLFWLVCKISGINHDHPMWVSRSFSPVFTTVVSTCNNAYVELCNWPIPEFAWFGHYHF